MFRLRSETRRRGTRALAAAFVLGALTLVALPGFLSHFRGALTPFFGDDLLNLVFVEWGAHQLALGLPDYWNAYFFHPAKMVMALSDHLIGLAALRLVLSGLGVGPLASYNLLLLASFVATGAAALWLARRAGLSPPAALFAAAAFAFSQFRLMHVGHLQILWAPFLPLALGTFDLLLARPSIRRAAAFVGCYALHLTGGSYLAYMIHFPLVAILALRLPQLRVAGDRARRAALLGATGLLCLAAAWLAFAPYGRAAEIHDLVRPAGYLRGFGATAASLFTPDSKSRLAPLLFDPARRPESSLFPGLVVAVLLAGAGARWLSATVRDLPTKRRWLLVASALLIAVAIALGDFRTWTGAERFELGALSFSIRKYTIPFRTLIVGLALLAFAARSRVPARRSPAAALRRSLGVAAGFALVLCFPLVYVPLARWVPGLDSMRVPTRFFAFASLGLALAAAIELDRWRRRLAPALRRFAVPLALALFALETAPVGNAWISLDPPERFPAVDRRIAEMPRVRVLAELPLPGPEACSLDTLRMYHATAHWKPIVNGCSGHFPASYEELRASISSPPRPEDLDRLRALGVTHLLLRDLGVAKRPRAHERRADWAKRNAEARHGAVVYDDGEAILFALDPDEPAEPSAALAPRDERRRRGSAR